MEAEDLRHHVWESLDEGGTPRPPGHRECYQVWNAVDGRTWVEGERRRESKRIEPGLCVRPEESTIHVVRDFSAVLHVADHVL